MKKEETIKTTKYANGIAIVTISHPKMKSALNSALIKELKESLININNDENIIVVIIRGSNGNFAAGVDINDMVGLDSKKAYDFASDMKALHNLILKSTKPYIAAIEGYCLGGGFELAMSCDIRLLDRKAKLGLPEINLGIIPGGGGIQRLFEIAGTSITSQLLMSGELIDGVKASELKIGSLVDGEVVNEAKNLAEIISRKSSKVISFLKKLINERNQINSQSNVNEEILCFSLLFDYPEALEGMSAFLQKRQAKFNGVVKK